MRKADNLPPYCAVVKKSGSLNFLDPSGPAWPVTGVLYLFPLHLIICWHSELFDCGCESVVRHGSGGPMCTVCSPFCVGLLRVAFLVLEIPKHFVKELFFSFSLHLTSHSYICICRQF